MRFRFILTALAVMLAVCAACTGEDDFLIDDDDDTALTGVSYAYQADFLLSRMTLEEKICQLLIVTPENVSGGTMDQNWDGVSSVRARPYGGIVFFGRNIYSSAQLSAFTAQINALYRSSGCWAPFLCIHEESGAAATLASKLGLERTPDACAVASPEEAEQSGLTIGRYLRGYGFNLDFAPCADVLVNTASGMEERAFSSDPGRVSEYARAMAAGLEQAGLLACYTHFPGSASTEHDIHSGKCTNRRQFQDCCLCELVPFSQNAASAGMIMVSHVTFACIDANSPASLSYDVVTSLLRQSLGFEGVIITDSLRMKPITENYTASQAAVNAIAAGADMLLLPQDPEKAISGILKAVRSGQLTENRIDESVRRILMLKIRSGVIQ